MAWVLATALVLAVVCGLLATLRARKLSQQLFTEVGKDVDALKHGVNQLKRDLARAEAAAKQERRSVPAGPLPRTRTAG